MKIRDVRLAFTTDASGDATTTSTEPVVGRLVAVEAKIAGMDATADFVISSTSTPGAVNRTFLTLTSTNTDAWFDTRGLGATAAGASTSEYVHPFIIGKPKVVVAQGGNAKSGVIILYVDADE